MTIELRFETTLPAASADVWAAVTTPAGVNRELRPLVRMTFPRSLPRLGESTVPVGEWLFHSWVLLFGVIPLDRHHFRFEAIVDGRGFQEDSASWLHRSWRHTRTLSDRPGTDSCVLVDELEIVPRFPLLTPVIRSSVRAVFRRRHRRLARAIGR